jgi:AcrR family transcriptional regulator
MPRSYRQTIRRDTSEKTRARILESVRGLLASAGFFEATIDDIATAAGVARATIYQHFGSKAGLLDALCDQIAEAGVLARVKAAFALPDPRAALEAGTITVVEFWASEHALFREAYAVAAVDPAALDFVARQRADQHGEVERLMHRLAADGLLRAGYGEKEATETLMGLTSFELFETLHARGGLDVESVGEIVRDLALGLLRKPGVGSSTPTSE